VSTFFFDNNLSPLLVAGLRGFGEDVQHLRDAFPENTKDSVWIPQVAESGWILVTRDKRIRTRPLEAEALVRAGLSAFFFVQKRDPDLWGWVEALVRRWTEMKELAERERRPFLFAVPERGRIDRLR
jgi:hypothetical protein